MAPKVLVVVNSLVQGGAERMLESLVLRLSAEGKVRYTICSLEDDGPIGGRLKRNGIEVMSLGLRGSGISIVLRGTGAVRKLLRQREFDLIHSVLYRSHCVSRLARLGLATRPPLLSAEHCLGHNRGFAIRSVNRVMSRMSDRILAVCKAVALEVTERDGVPAGQVTVVPNGVAASQPNPRARARLRRTLSIDDSQVLFLFLGRLHREKGPDLFLTALDHLRRAGVGGWRAVVVGDGPERTNLRRFVEKAGMEKLVFLSGHRRRVEPWLDAADILVQPSREEGMPVAVLEAMMHAKPVIASCVGGAPEVVKEGETGLLVPPGEAARLVDAMKQLLASPLERQRMGTRGLLLARDEYTIDLMAERTMQQYELLLSKGLPDEDRARQRNVMSGTGVVRHP